MKRLILTACIFFVLATPALAGNGTSPSCALYGEASGADNRFTVRYTNKKHTAITLKTAIISTRQMNITSVVYNGDTIWSGSARKHSDHLNKILQPGDSVTLRYFFDGPARLGAILNYKCEFPEATPSPPQPESQVEPRRNYAKQVIRFFQILAGVPRDRLVR